MPVVDNILPGQIHIVIIWLSTRLAGETTLSSAVKLQNYTAIRNLNFMLCNLDNCVEKGSADYNQYVGEAYYFRAWYYYQMFISYGRLTWVNTPLDPNMEEMKLPRANRTTVFWLIWIKR